MCQGVLGPNWYCESVSRVSTEQDMLTLTCVNGSVPRHGVSQQGDGELARQITILDEREDTM